MLNEQFLFLFALENQIECTAFLEEIASEWPIEITGSISSSTQIMCAAVIITHSSAADSLPSPHTHTHTKQLHKQFSTLKWTPMGHETGNWEFVPGCILVWEISAALNGAIATHVHASEECICATSGTCAGVRCRRREKKNIKEYTSAVYEYIKWGAKEGTRLAHNTSCMHGCHFWFYLKRFRQNIHFWRESYWEILFLSMCVSCCMEFTSHYPVSQSTLENIPGSVDPKYLIILKNWCPVPLLAHADMGNHWKHTCLSEKLHFSRLWLC